MPKVLIVEDDELLAQGISYALTREKWSVLCADSVALGWQTFSTEPCDFVLLDVSLPDGTGFELCRRIRESSSVPIVFLTAKDEEVHIIQGFDLGADDYVTKPFRLSELLSRIKAILRRVGQQPVTAEGGHTINSGPITANLAEGKAYKAGRELALTPTEYRLLLLFLRNPQQILSRNQILDLLFDLEGQFLDSNTLSVYIRRLREKVEENPQDPALIVTERGLGYKWNRRSD